MRVVMGGVASQCKVSLERLDDMELAVETIMAEEPAQGEEFVLSCSAEGGILWVRLDGLVNRSVRAALLAVDPFRPCPDCLLDVRLFLDALVDGYQVCESREGAFAVEFERGY